MPLSSYSNTIIHFGAGNQSPAFRSFPRDLSSPPPALVVSRTTSPPMATPRAWSPVEMLAGVIWESRRVVAAHSRHFLALSVLFLLPLSSLLVAAPLLLVSPSLSPHSGPPQFLLRSASLSAAPSAAALSIAALVAVFLVACAAAAITHSVHRGFFGRPVRLLPALRSVPASLWRFFLTFLSAAFSLAALVTVSYSLFLLLHRILVFLHFSPPPLAVPLAFAGVTVAAAIYFRVNWSLALVVAVVESTWGFKALRRSTYLVQGMRRAALCLYLFFVTGIGMILWGFSLRGVGVAESWSEVVPVVAQTVFGSAVTALLLLYCLVTDVVLYLYCKALHGELARDIAEEFAWEYICLPFDDQKVPHVISVVQQ